MTVRSIFCCVPAGAPSGGRSCFGGGPFLAPGAPRRVEGILMDPATSTKTTCIQLFLFYSTIPTVLQGLFYNLAIICGFNLFLTRAKWIFWGECTSNKPPPRPAAAAAEGARRAPRAPKARGGAAAGGGQRAGPGHESPLPEGTGGADGLFIRGAGSSGRICKRRRTRG